MTYRCGPTKQNNSMNMTTPTLMSASLFSANTRQMILPEATDATGLAGFGDLDGVGSPEGPSGPLSSGRRRSPGSRRRPEAGIIAAGLGSVAPSWAFVAHT